MSGSAVKERVRRWLPENQFVRSAGVLAGGTMAGQIIVILASPVITRLYTPDDFGVLAVFAAILSIIVVIASLRYQLAIPLPENNGLAANVVVLSLGVVGAMTLFSGLAVWLLGDQITTWTNATALAPYLWLLPIGVALGGMYQVFNYWAVRVKAFSRIARTKFQQGSGKVGTQIGLGLLQFGPVGLIIGQIVGQAAGLTHLVRTAWRDDRRLLENIQQQQLRKVAYQYRQFPVYSTGAGLANTAGAKLPLILFSALFSPAVAGLYMLAYRVVKAPMGLLNQAVGQVFFGNAAEARRSGRLNEITLGAFQSLVRIGTGPLLVFAVLAPEIFDFVFGADWYQAGVYVQFLSPMLLLNFCYSPLSTLSSVLRLERSSLIFQLSLLVSRGVGVLIGAFLGKVWVAILLYAVGSGVVYFARMVWLFGKAGVKAVVWCRAIFVELLIVFPVVLMIWFIKELILYNMGGDSIYVSILLVLSLAFSIVGIVMWRVIPFIRSDNFMVD